MLYAHYLCRYYIWFLLLCAHTESCPCAVTDDLKMHSCLEEVAKEKTGTLGSQEGASWSVWSLQRCGSQYGTVQEHS